jgi:GNAT superfamily N-acetyltransferase
MEEAEVLRRWRAGHRAFYRWFDGASPGARVTERPDGILYLVCPARPERSFVNAVLYDDAAALPGALPELARVYDDAGVQASTVWVHAGDDRAAAACAEAGHVLDATPELMWAPLDAMALDTIGVLLDEAPSWTTVGDVNDAAYGLPRDHLSITLRDADPRTGLRAVALHDGRPVATAAVAVAEHNAAVVLVATLPEARGRGLAAACMRSCLRRARDRGATTTTLEATQLGRPVYRGMGYRELGALGMWERRRPAA